MYLPSYFEETRVPVLQALMRAHPLAALITVTDAGLAANHIPVETLAAPEPLGMLRGHIAKANPLWRQYRDGQDVLAIFQGPQTYITPAFYAEKMTSGKVVPTWDYAVVHARGTLSFTHDAAWLHALVTRLTDAHEATRAAAWKVTDAPGDYVSKMLSAIVGFEFSVVSLAGKWKVSQNRRGPDRAGVISGLRAADDPDAAKIAEMLAERHGPDDAP